MSNLTTSNTERFTHNVNDYVQYRPDYPQALIDYLVKKCCISHATRIADIGSGTGIFTQQLLTTGAQVVAIEPNQAMRQSAENVLKAMPNFSSLDATAEQTQLANASVGMISVATAFHWFDYAACQQEFRRILRHDGWVALVWNLRLPDLSPVAEGYENILKRHCPQYNGIPSQQITEQKLLDFFANASAEIKTFDNQQQLDLAGLWGRFRSTSYVTDDISASKAMQLDVQKLFERHAQAGQITFPYLTKLFIGQLGV